MKNSNTKKTKFLITIAGPTAVGKTAHTIALAKEHNAEIFSADSRQLYKETSIGTAKPTQDEMDGIIHHFIDHISIQTPYNAGQYGRDFDQLTTSYFENHNIAILTGGTGMYLKAALEGLDHFPTVTSETKRHFQDLYDSEGIAKLQVQLKEQDPEYYKIVDVDNPRRISRALEVIASGNQPYSHYLALKQEKNPIYHTIKICLIRDRAELYDRINQRVDLMIDAGLVAEVAALQEYQYLNALQTVGYSEIFGYLNGVHSLDRAIELIKRNSRRYAKRQMTWFRNQGDWTMIDAHDYNKLQSEIVQLIAK